MIDWFFQSIDPSRLHDLTLSIKWHGRLMVFAWGILLPIGILWARFNKITPRQSWPQQLDSQVWWHGHRLFQYTGTAVALLALYLILKAPTYKGGVNTLLHMMMGWSTLIICVVQVVLGLARGSKGGPTDPARDGSWKGDHYLMTARRRWFEILHKLLGYGVLFLAWSTALTGLWISNAPRWMFVALLLNWIVLGGLFLLLQRRGLAIDTYQAIWGPDGSHPGNHVPPIGFGISKPSDKGSD